MKLVVTQNVSNILQVARDKKILNIAPFDNAVGKISLSVMQAVGDLILGNGAGAVTNLAAGSSGQVLTSNGPASLPTWQAAAGGGSCNLTNKSGLAVSAGDVLVIDSTNDSAFTTTTVSNDLRVCGVAGAGISSNAVGQVISVAGVLSTVNCDSGVISRGDWLVSSSTLGKAMSAGSMKPPAGFAIATTAKGAGVGAVSAIMMPQMPFPVSGTKSYSLGGWTGAAAITDGQRFTFASATWAVVAGAALPAVRGFIAGCGNTTTAGWAIGGQDSTPTSHLEAYQMPYATETTAAVASGNLAAIRSNLNYGANSATAGYIPGGAAYVTTINKLLYSSSTTTTLGAVLSQARSYLTNLSDGTYAYVQGGFNGSAQVTSDRITLASDTCGANAGSNLTAANYYLSGMSFPAIAGYVCYTSFTNKVTYASGTSSNIGNVISTAILGASGISDGNGQGYISGGVSPTNVTNAFSRASETFSAVPAANFVTSKGGAATFNNGAY